MRVDRLLSILLIISNKGMVTGNELAEHFEVSLRTIYRDIDKLCEAGVPIAASGGKGGGYYIMDNYNIDKMFLNKNELQTFMAVMNNLKLLFGKNQQFNDIVLKFDAVKAKESSNKDKLSINMSHFSMEEELKEYLYLIDKAIEEGRLLELYYINRRFEKEKRLVEPIFIDYRRGEWFLVGFCRNRAAYRRFKLVRIKALDIAGAFIRRDISIDELRNIFYEEFMNKSICIKLKFIGRIGERLGEYFLKENITEQKDGSYIVTDYSPYEEGLINFILGFGKDCEVLEPDYLRAEVKKTLQEIMLSYNG